MARFMYDMSMSWSTFRLDTLSLASVTATALLVTFLPSDQVDAASAGLALSYAISVSVMLNCNWILFAITPTFSAFHLLWYLHAMPAICYDTFHAVLPIPYDTSIQCLSFAKKLGCRVFHFLIPLDAVSFICYDTSMQCLPFAMAFTCSASHLLRNLDGVPHNRYYSCMLCHLLWWPHGVPFICYYTYM